MASELPYPVTYQRETAPAWLHYAATLAGAVAADPGKPFRAMELGCGRGFSTLIHAAANPASEFHAVDADDAAIAGARDWAKAVGLDNATFHNVLFDHPSLRALGKFDFIVLHGVYSWVDEAARATLRDLVPQLLADNGVVYLSYNCLPGWSAEIPLRRLLGELGNAAPSGERVGYAVKHADALRKAGFGFFTAHPTADRAVAGLGDQPAGYLAQEYLADAWEPMWSLDVHEAMAGAGLAYAASATLHDNYDALLLSGTAASAIAQLPTPRLQTLARDFAVNRTFRRDLFVHANRSATRRDPGALLLGHTGDIETLPDNIVTPRGRITFAADFIAALRTLLANGPVRLDAATRVLSTKGKPDEAMRNLLWLTAGGVLQPFATDTAEPLPSEAATVWLSRIAGGEIPWLPSPSSGGGVEITPRLAAALRDNTETKAAEAARRRLRRLAIL